MFQLYITGTGNDTCRIILLQTKGSVTSAPATGSVLIGASTYAPYVYNSRELYEVVHDEYISLALSGDSAMQTHRWMIKPRVQDYKFLVGTNDLYNGQFYLMFMASNATNIATNGYIRQWFEDSN